MTNLETFRQETRTWLEENCPASMRTPAKEDDDYYWGGRNATFKNEDQKVWFERMAARGWTAPTWPAKYGGGGLSPQEYKIFQEEMARLKCRLPLLSFGIWMLGPALLKYGSEKQKMEHIPKIIRGEIRWCQGYSEPNAGSDLASLQTRAEPDSHGFIVSGQKVWTSYADKADWIFCLVRTDFEVPKHNGISFLLIDMASDGVSTRPIKLISGKSPFCETFFDNVKVPGENLMGELNKGWSIAKYLLTHERDMIGGIGDTTEKKTISEFAIEHVGLKEGKLDHPVLRSEVSKLEIDKLAYDFTIERALDEAKAGQGSGAKSSMFKYIGTEQNKIRYELMIALAGVNGLVWDGEEYENGKLTKQWLRTKGNSIEGGTSEIQLNILAKRVLGLPSM